MDSVKVKICGITNAGDALAAAECGADALGFVFYDKSPRSVSPQQAADIIALAPPFITTVGVFVNEDPSRIREIAAFTRIHVVQLHGDESPADCGVWHRVIKAFRVSQLSDLGIIRQYAGSTFLLDAYSPESYGGTGQTFNWDIAVEAKGFGRIILSGGLTPENVERAVQRVRPYAVDVSSGIERSKGRKDHDRMRDFIERAKAALSRP